jgi:Flp pilus assembly protein TadG
MRSVRHEEAGGAAVELTLVTPLLLLFMLLVVALGRLATARADVDGAARDAARAASIARDAGQAERAARQAAAATLDERGVTCRRLDVFVDIGAFRPGGLVVADVTCVVDLADLALLRLPGTRAISARFVAPVDTFRAVA